MKCGAARCRSEYEFGGATLTSITAHYESEGLSRGDIDGGNAVFLPDPGFIPFPSDTQDSIDLSQTTQEIRLASRGGGPFTWQVGAFYFDSDFTVLTEGFTFPPPVAVRHTNESWAVFGQIGMEVTEGVTLTAGLRYTEDDKDFEVVSGAGPNDRSVGDERLSWDLAGDRRGGARHQIVRPRRQRLSRADHPGPRRGLLQPALGGDLGEDHVL